MMKHVIRNSKGDITTEKITVREVHFLSQSKSVHLKILNSLILQAYKTCGVWENSGHEESYENTERDLFIAEPLFQNLVANVSRRLGFLYNISIGTYREIMLV